MGAAFNGNVELTRLLLARKPRLTSCRPTATAIVKNGPVLFGNVTALHMATSSGNVDGRAAAARRRRGGGRGGRPRHDAADVGRRDRSAGAAHRPPAAREGRDPAVASKVGETAASTGRASSTTRRARRAAAGAGRRTQRHRRGRRSPHWSRPRSRRAQHAAAAQRLAAGDDRRRLRRLPCAADDRDGGGHAAARGWRSSAPAPSVARSPTLATGAAALLQAREGGGSPTRSCTRRWCWRRNAPPTLGTDARCIPGGQAAAGGQLARRRRHARADAGRRLQPDRHGIRALTAYAMPARRREFTERIAARGRVARRADADHDRRPRDAAARAGVGRRQRRRRRGAHARAASPCSAPTAAGRRRRTCRATPTPPARRSYTLRELGVAASDPALQRGVAFLLRTQARRRHVVREEPGDEDPALLRERLPARPRPVDLAGRHGVGGDGAERDAAGAATTPSNSR